MQLAKVVKEKKSSEKEEEDEEKDEGIEADIPDEKSKKPIDKTFKIEYLAKKLRALVGLGIVIGVLYIIVYNMFVPHSDKKEIPQEVIQTLLKIAAGSAPHPLIAPLIDNINSSIILE